MECLDAKGDSSPSHHTLCTASVSMQREWNVYKVILSLQNRRFCVPYAKTPKTEVLRPPQKIQNRRFCVVLKILVIILNTPKSEVLCTIRKNSKNGGLHPLQKLQNRRFCVVLKILVITFNTPKSEVLHIPAYYTQKLQKRRFCAHRRNSKI